jgi:hypothetical protein
MWRSHARKKRLRRLLHKAEMKSAYALAWLCALRILPGLKPPGHLGMLKNSVKRHISCGKSAALQDCSDNQIAPPTAKDAGPVEDEAEST